ncbi:MAG: hypothetical protein GY780_03115 [bacterium]|nr:hypothetical protein [bacterium]
MKKLIVLLMVMVMATSAFAIIDPDDDMMGLYFDMEADNPEVMGALPYSTNVMYLVITNPSFDALYGFEAGYTMEGPGQVLSTVFANPQALNVGTADNMIVGFGSPTATAPVTLLATISVLYMSSTNEAVAFTLHGTNPSSVDPMYPVVLLANGIESGYGLSAADGPAAGINLVESVVATDEVTFDGIKSLYR